MSYVSVRIGGIGLEGSPQIGCNICALSMTHLLFSPRVNTVLLDLIKVHVAHVSIESSLHTTGP